MLAGAGQPAPCTGGLTTNGKVRERVTRAEKQIPYQEYAPAREALDAAAADLACLSEPAEASLAARLLLFRGFVARETGDTPAASDSFARALAFQPDLVWDEKLPPDGKPLFDQARARIQESPGAKLLLGPGTGGAPTIWVDGRLAETTGVLVLSEGRHLVQLLKPTIRTFEVIAQAGRPMALLVPADAAALPLEDLARSGALSAIVEGHGGEAQAAWMWTGTRTWKGGDTWTELPVSNAVRREARVRTGRTLVAAGLAGAGIGAVGAAFAWTSILSSVEPVEGEHADGELRRQAVIDVSSPWAYATTGLAVVGVAVAGTGFVLQGGGAAPVSLNVNGAF